MRAVTAMRVVFDVVRLVADLVVGEAQGRQTCSLMFLVTPAVAALLVRGAVVTETVGLDNQPQVGPVEVDPIAVDALLSQRLRKVGGARDWQEVALQLGVGEREGGLVEERAEVDDAGLACVGVELGA